MDDSTRPAYDKWIGQRSLASVGTNHGSDALAFQRWHKFKEAFAPEIVAQAIDRSQLTVTRVLDPFGGSGTTALAAQLLGISPVTVEVNPYLQDVVESKLVRYNLDSLLRSAQAVTNAPTTNPSSRWLPPTFVEPGARDRWLFSKSLWSWVQSTLDEINALDDANERRLFKVLLGGTLVPISNVRVSGKGRRYRGHWASHETNVEDASELFSQRVDAALEDIRNFDDRPTFQYELIRGDSRTSLGTVRDCELVVFSPPYPNSFDYTDIYNVELWALGYLADMAENRTLRKSTLSSHVQIDRQFEAAPSGSHSLEKLMVELTGSRDSLWSPKIPTMVGGYFADMHRVLRACSDALKQDGQVWMVVGDSQYASIKVPVAAILGEFAESLGFELLESYEARSMRRSPQQGGDADLAESVLVFRKR